MAHNKSMIGQHVKENISVWCDGCKGTSFCRVGHQDPEDSSVEIRQCEEGHVVKTTYYVYTENKDATRFNV